MLVGDCDVDIRREVSPIQLRRKILVHVEGIGVDVKLMARSFMITPPWSKSRNFAYFPIAMMS